MSELPAPLNSQIRAAKAANNSGVALATAININKVGSYYVLFRFMSSSGRYSVGVWIGAMERLVNLLTKAVKRTKTQGVQRTTEHEEGFISVYFRYFC